MGMIERHIMQVFLTVEKSEMIKWLKLKGANFIKGDYSIPAIQYFINNYSDKIIQDYLRYDGLQIKEIKIEESTESKLRLIFESGLIYPSLHDKKKKELIIMMVEGANLYKFNYHEEIKLIPIK